MSWDVVLGLGFREYKVFRDRDDVMKITDIHKCSCVRSEPLTKALH